MGRGGACSEDLRRNIVTTGMVLSNPQLTSLPVWTWGNGSLLTRSCSCVLDLIGEPGLSELRTPGSPLIQEAVLAESCLGSK